jgi:hypothetical protein
MLSVWRFIFHRRLAMAKDAKAPYEIDPLGSFMRVASLQNEIKQAKKNDEIARSRALETRNTLKKLQAQLSDMIDGESDPRPNLFSGILAQQAAPVADMAAVKLDQIGLKQKDCEWLVGNGITTLGELNAARLNGKMAELKPTEAVLKRLSKAVQEFMAAAGLAAPPEPAAPEKKPRARKADGEAAPRTPRKKKGEEAAVPAEPEPAAA